MSGKAEWVRFSWMAAVLLPLLAGITSAVGIDSTRPQTNQPNQQDQQDQQVVTSPEQAVPFEFKLEKAKNLLGANIVNDRGEELGTVPDIVLTSNRDGINYVVLAHGWTWGTSQKYFAVPWSQFGFQPGEKEDREILVLKAVSKADLDQAPGFDKNHWPALASENWLGLERGSGMTPAGGVSMRPPAEHRMPGAAPAEAVPSCEPSVNRDQSARVVESERGTGGTAESGAVASLDIRDLRLSKLLGIAIRNPQDENLGKLDDAMIDVRLGKLTYGIVAVRHGFLGLNQDFVAVPWSVLNLTAQPGIARLDAERDTLLALAFDRDHFPNLEDPQYSRQLYERFHAPLYWEALGFIPGEERPEGESAAVPEMTVPEATTPHEMKADKDGYPLPYNPNAVETIQGTVTKVQNHRVKGVAAKVVRLTIKTAPGKTLRIDVGPASYVDRQNIRFHRGDAVTITGSRAKMGRHDILVASQIQTGDKTLRLRTDAGRPLWNLDELKGQKESKNYRSYQGSAQPSADSEQTRVYYEW